MTPPNPPLWPSPYSLRAWQLYEPIVVTWLRIYPSEYIFKPDNFSSQTVVPRLRNAIDGFLRYKYPSTVDPTLLSIARAEVSITLLESDPTKVRIGPRIGRRSAIHLAEPDPNSITSDLAFSVDNLIDLTAAMILLNSGKISATVSVRDPSGNLIAAFHEREAQFPNLSIIGESSQSFTFL